MYKKEVIPQVDEDTRCPVRVGPEFSRDEPLAIDKQDITSESKVCHSL